MSPGRVQRGNRAEARAHEHARRGWLETEPELERTRDLGCDERRVRATIAELAENPARLGLKSPAVLIFGEVAGLPASGIVETILSLEEVKRLYA